LVTSSTGNKTQMAKAARWGYWLQEVGIGSIKRESKEPSRPHVVVAAITVKLRADPDDAGLVLEILNLAIAAIAAVLISHEVVRPSQPGAKRELVRQLAIARKQRPLPSAVAA